MDNEKAFLKKEKINSNQGSNCLSEISKLWRFPAKNRKQNYRQKQNKTKIIYIRDKNVHLPNLIIKENWLMAFQWHRFTNLLLFFFRLIQAQSRRKFNTVASLFS